VCPPSSGEYRRHLVLRDYLRSHPKEAQAYGHLKHSLAQKFAHDRAAYIAGKEEFVRELLERALARPGGESV